MTSQRVDKKGSRRSNGWTTRRHRLRTEPASDAGDTSHPVVVDQLVGLHFVLRSDGPLGLDLHPAVVASVKAQTLK